MFSPSLLVSLGATAIVAERKELARQLQQQGFIHISTAHKVAPDVSALQHLTNVN